jgi:hypothetical protein
MAEDLHKRFTVKIDSIKIYNDKSLVAFSQGDVKTAILIIELTENDKALDLTGKKVRAAFRKADGKNVMQDQTTGVSITDAIGGKVQIVLSTQVLAAKGNVRGQLSITDEAAGLVAETVEFGFTVRESLLNSSIVSLNELPIVEKMIDAADVLGEVDLQTIVNNTENVNSLKSEVETARGTAGNLSGRFSNIESSVAQKLTKDESGSVTWAMAAQDFREQITGGNTAVVGVNAVLETNITDKAVSERKLSAKLQQDLIIPAENLITNGAFETNYTPWTVGTTTASVSGNKLKLNFPTTSTQSAIYPGGRVVGHKYYGRLVFEKLAGSFVEIAFFTAGIKKVISVPLSTPTVISSVDTAASVGGSLFQFTFTTPTAGAEVTISRPLFIDLTAAFGAGNEPSAEEMDYLLSFLNYSWFDGTYNLASTPKLLKQHIDLWHKKANQTEVDDLKQIAQSPGVLVDKDTNATVGFSVQKNNNELEYSWQTKNDEVTMNTSVVNNITLSDLFTTKNRITNSHFNSDLSGYTISTGTPTVSTSVYNTPSKSMKVFGTASQYMLEAYPTNVVGKLYFIAAKVKVDRYVSGSGVGFQLNQPTYGSLARFVNYVTSGFVTVSGIVDIKANYGNIILGSVGNADGYIDDFVMVDITGLNVDVTAMTRFYELYLKLIKGETATEPITKKYRLVSDEMTTTHYQDAMDAFVKKMNEKASQIGMTKSSFTNPAGGDNGVHKVTAKDFVKMTINACGYKDLVQMWNKKDYTINTKGINPRAVAMETSVKSPALENYYHIFGGKTGTTTLMNLVVVVNAPNGRMFVGSIVDSPTDRFADAKAMFDIATAYLNGTQTGTETINAKAGAVALLPIGNPFMYQGFNTDFIWSKDGDTLYYPASTTKVMTAMVALDYITNLNEKIIIQSSDIAEGSGNYFVNGDIITFKDALYAMMLPSSNTCANAVARVVGEKILRVS